MATKEFLRICSKEELAEKAQDIEVTTPVTKSQEARYNLDQESFFINRFWGRRPDGVAINNALQIVYILEFKRSTHRDQRFLEVKEAEANEQYKNIIGALTTKLICSNRCAAASEWKFKHISFLVGNRGSVVGGER